MLGHSEKETILDRRKRPGPGLTPRAPRRETGLAIDQLSAIPPQDMTIAHFPIRRSATLRIFYP